MLRIPFSVIVLHHFPLVIIAAGEVVLHVQTQLHNFNLFECENWSRKIDPNISTYIEIIVLEMINK